MTPAQFRAFVRRPRTPDERFLQLMTLRLRLIAKRLVLAAERAIAATRRDSRRRIE